MKSWVMKIQNTHFCLETKYYKYILCYKYVTAYVVDNVSGLSPTGSDFFISRFIMPIYLSSSINYILIKKHMSHRKWLQRSGLDI